MDAMLAVFGGYGVLHAFYGGAAAPRRSSRYYLLSSKSSASLFGISAVSTRCRGGWRWSVSFHHRRRPEFRVWGNSSVVNNNGNGEDEEEKDSGGIDNRRIVGTVSTLQDVFPAETMAIVAACVVGLFTGIGVVLFNIAVHEIRDFFWDGIPSRGASWLREEPIEVIWERVILVPTCGGLLVSLLNMLRTSMEVLKDGISISSLKSAVEPALKAVAACVTL